MARIIEFPEKEDTFDMAVKAIENRFGVSIWEYLGERTKETESKIDRALRKETLKIKD